MILTLRARFQRPEPIPAFGIMIANTLVVLCANEADEGEFWGGRSPVAIEPTTQASADELYRLGVDQGIALGFLGTMYRRAEFLELAASVAELARSLSPAPSAPSTSREERD